MKASMKMMAVLAISMSTMYADAGEVHDHKRMKGHVGAAESEKPISRDDGSIADVKDDPKRVHDHRRQKGFAGSGTGESAGSDKRCEQAGPEQSEDCVAEKKAERIHDHRKMKNLP